MKEGCAILASAFLSLLLPLSFHLLARLSTARYFTSVADDHTHNNSFLSFVFVYSNTTLILSTLVFLTSIAALANIVLTGDGTAYFIISQRCRLYGAWFLLFVMKICLCLGIQGSVDAKISGYTVGRLVQPRRVALVLGLHESMFFWWRSVVKPVVDETVFESIREDLKRVEKLAMTVAFGYLWWQKLREEAESLVVVPWVMAELRMEVRVADYAGWFLYYLTVAIGVVRVVKGVALLFVRIFRYRSKVKSIYLVQYVAGRPSL